MKPNRFPGHCHSCQRTLAPGDGVAVKRGGWVIACKSETCQLALGLIKAKKRLDASGLLVHPFEESAVPLLRSAPGARFVKGKGWRVSVDDSNLTRTIEIAQRLGCQIDPVLIARAAKGSPLMQTAVKRGEKAYAFQREGIRFLAGKNKALLADEMGCGKTIQALLAMPCDERVIIIAPATVKYNWKGEGEKWRPEYKFSVLEGRGTFRIPELGEALIMNYELLPEWLLADELVAPGDTLSLLRGAILIVDEAHKAKNHKSKRAEKVKVLSGLCKRTWLLTGTPLVNGKPFDLWGVLSAGGMAKEVFGDWNRFMELFGGYQDEWGGYKFAPVPSPEVAERLRRVSLRRLRADVLADLPRKAYQEIMVDEPTGTLKKKLDALLRLLIERGEISRDSAGALSGGLPKFEEFSEIRALLAKSRIPAMMELVEAAEEQGEPLVVFSAHRAPIEALGEREGWATILGGEKAEARTAIVERFQSGKSVEEGGLIGIAATIGAGGVGITLTKGSVALFVDRSWVPADNSQAEDRLVRIGQKAGSVLIQSLYTNHPLDIHVHRLLTKKQRLIEAAIDSTVALAPSNEMRP